MPINYALREELERQIDEHNQRKKKRNFIVPKIGGSPPPPTPPEADYFFQTPYSAKQSAQLQPQSQAAPQMKQQPQQQPPQQHQQQQQAAQAPLQHPQPQWSPQQELPPPVSYHHYYQQQPQPQPVRQVFAYPSLPVGGTALPAGPDPTFVPYHPQPQSSNLPPGAPAVSSSSSHAVVRSAPFPTPHDFFHLDSKWEEQQRKKEQDRKKAEELRQALEEQIALKNQLHKRRRDAELREARDAEDAFKRRADEEARRRAEHAQQQAKAFADLQEQNRSLAQNHQVAAPPTATGKAAELPPRELRSPSPSLFPPTADGPLSPLSADPIRADTVVVSPAPHSTSTADLREVLSRIHTELMQQRQMVMSPSGYSMGLAVPPPRLPPLSFKPAAPPSLVPSMRDEMVTDTAFVGRKDDVFSMTSVQSGMSPPRLPRSNVFEINACLKKNHDRLQRLQFARNADDVLKVFLSHDAPLGATRSNFDLQPPSSMLS